MINTVNIVGAGNVGTHLAKVLYQSNVDVRSVFSRNRNKAASLAEEVNSVGVSNLNELSHEVDLVLVAVTDDAIAQVMRELDSFYQNKVIAHTSGATELRELKNNVGGVFYPLQTFSKDREIDWKEVPVCIELQANERLDELLQLAGKFSKHVHQVDSVQRAQLHLAAVFACNFSNHLFAVADKLLQHQNMPFSLLGPLIRETVEKAGRISPAKAQTGPAIRNDRETMAGHLDALKEQPGLQELYQLMSKLISQANGKGRE